MPNSALLTERSCNHKRWKVSMEGAIFKIRQQCSLVEKAIFIITKEWFLSLLVVEHCASAICHLYQLQNLKEYHYNQWLYNYSHGTWVPVAQTQIIFDPSLIHLCVTGSYSYIIAQTWINPGLTNPSFVRICCILTLKILLFEWPKSRWQISKLALAPVAHRHIKFNSSVFN